LGGSNRRSHLAVLRRNQLLRLRWAAYRCADRSIASPFLAMLPRGYAAVCANRAVWPASLSSSRNPGRGWSTYLHSWSVRSRAWEKPLSENVSVDCVPLTETPFTTALWPDRRASISRASSDTFLIQAPSCWV